MRGDLRGRVVSRSVKTLSFILKHKYWTLMDLQDELNMANTSNARYYLDAFSIHFPIREVKPVRNLGWGKGRISAIYSVDKKALEKLFK